MFECYAKWREKKNLNARLKHIRNCCTVFLFFVRRVCALALLVSPPRESIQFRFRYNEENAIAKHMYATGIIFSLDSMLNLVSFCGVGLLFWHFQFIPQIHTQTMKSPIVLKPIFSHKHTHTSSASFFFVFLLLNFNFHRDNFKNIRKWGNEPFKRNAFLFQLNSILKRSEKLITQYIPKKPITCTNLMNWSLIVVWSLHEKPLSLGNCTHPPIQLENVAQKPEQKC